MILYKFWCFFYSTICLKKAFHLRIAQASKPSKTTSHTLQQLTTEYKMAKQQQRPQARPQQSQRQVPAPVRRTEKKENLFSAGSSELIFGRQNFLLMGIGLALVLIGLAAMVGGAMPDPAKWEPERIYSFRRITLAPILMVAGFVAVIFGIFKKMPTSSANPNYPEA
jgi:type IV secretory pathway TrbD component